MNLKWGTDSAFEYLPQLGHLDSFRKGLYCESKLWGKHYLLENVVFCCLAPCQVVVGCSLFPDDINLGLLKLDIFLKLLNFIFSCIELRNIKPKNWFKTVGLVQPASLNMDLPELFAVNDEPHEAKLVLSLYTQSVHVVGLHDVQSAYTYPRQTEVPLGVFTYPCYSYVGDVKGPHKLLCILDQTFNIRILGLDLLLRQYDQLP